jgi:hypothetical protein
MKNIHEQVESETLKRVRDRYEATGYRVLVKPRSRDVPQFLEGFEPNAIALIHGFTRVTVSRNHIDLLVNVVRRLLGQETNQPKSTQ